MLVKRQQGGVRLLTIDRPQRRNALSAEVVTALRVGLRECEEDSGTRAVVLTGAPPGFCAGSDLKELARLDLAGMRANETTVSELARSLAFMDKPVIAAVDGFALGGGFILAASCDIVVAARRSRWHLPEVTLGWIPPWGLATLNARVGAVVARKVAWGAEPMDGTEAHRLGIVDHLGDDAVATAIAIATRLAELPSHSVSTTKRFFAGSVSNGGEAADALASMLFCENCRHDVAQVTLRRFGMKQP